MPDQRRKVTVITGASRGVGKQLLETFVASGHQVFGLDRDPEVKRTAANLGAVGVEVDITQQAEVSDAIESFPRVDVLINNAGVVDRLGNALELEIDEYRHVMDVNAFGALLCTKIALPGMVDRARGAIVNVASVAGLRGGRAGTAYTMSKWALVGLTMNVAATLGSQGIRANVVAPGSIVTSMGASSITDNIFPSAQKLLFRDRAKPEAATPSEIAEVVHFLASDAANRVNGAVVPVDAGWIAY